ncbi:MAG: heavy metal translocating P-type ATPase, partial [Bacilli bacterium]
APALVEATLGIAMGDGTDVAIDVADGVLVNNDFAKLSLTHAVSKKLKHIVIQNIAFAMGVVFLLITLNFFLTLPMGVAVAVHEGSTVIVILNGLRLLNFKDKKKDKKKIIEKMQ